MNESPGFDDAYDAMLGRWPDGVEEVDVITPYGSTHVLSCGDPAAEPVVLLPGGGDTAMGWTTVAQMLAPRRRVHAVDLPNCPGRTVADGVPLRDRDGVVAWLGSVLDGLGIDRAHLVGHSYGGWLALALALGAPERLSRLSLLAPSQCFTGDRWAYLLRALPVLARPTPGRMQSLLTWETRGAVLDTDFLRLVRAAASRRWGRVVRPTRFSDEELRALDLPVQLLLADGDRSMSAAACRDKAEATIGDLTTTVVPDATHHTLPIQHAEQVASLLVVTEER